MSLHSITIFFLSTLPAFVALAAEPMIPSAIGITRRGTEIQCRLSREDLNFATSKTRVLLIGGLDGAKASEGTIKQALTWYSSDEAKDYRQRFVVSAVPNANPDRTDLLDSFPPGGPAYNSKTDPEAAYLWRWIGMHAPDVVIDVRVEGEEGSRIAVPDSELASLIRFQQGRSKSIAKPDLAGSLSTKAACETGKIPAFQLTCSSDPMFLSRLLDDLKDEFNEPSPARHEIQKRLDRTPIQVATQLSKHYGHNLNQVVYIPALALMARLRLGRLAEDDSHRKSVEKIVSPYVRGDKRTSPKSGSGLSGHLIFCELAASADGDARKRYIELARAASDFGIGRNGTPMPHMPYHVEMSDSLFMGGPILARVGQLTGDTRYFEACVNHLKFMRKLVLRDDGIYRHSPLDEAAWGRGNGFPALGLAMCLTHFPKDHPSRKELLGYYRDHMQALKAHQDPTGCWHQVIDKPGSYRELTSTCMITYAMIRGVRSGWLEPAEFATTIDKAWYAIRTRVTPNGRLVDVCTGTGKQKNLQAYYDRTAILGSDARGGAMALLVSTEMAAWQAEVSR